MGPEDLFLLRLVDEEMLESLPEPRPLEPGRDGAEPVGAFRVADTRVMVKEPVMVDQPRPGGGGAQSSPR
jgi:hypothetical protein